MNAIAAILIAGHRNRRKSPLRTLGWIVNQNRPVTYREIAQGAGVGFRTVHDHTDWLLERDFIFYATERRTRMGAPTSVITATPLAKRALGES